ncbi:MAG: alpha/beta hydrolase [Acidobacteria bacterium]|nr:alpha/beta hydrolase [Acidobacteriota bacterium]
MRLVKTRQTIRIAAFALAVLCIVPAMDLAAQTLDTYPEYCSQGDSSTGAKYLICVPPPGQWNGDLVVYAHGYVSPYDPLAVQDNVIDGTPISQIITSLGYAFATTSYPKNGLVIPDAVEDVAELVGCFKTTKGAPRNVFLVGASEGGLVTARAIEKYPDVFNGGLAACGPVGDFRKQLNYFGDFLVLFNYFFPGVLEVGGKYATPRGIPEEIIRRWGTAYEAAVREAIEGSLSKTRQLLRTAGVPAAPTDSETVQTVVDILWYNIFGTNDAIGKLGGSPYSNIGRWYSGSSNDILLNLLVKRYSADRGAVDKIQTGGYQTSGVLQRPLVTMHTTDDPIVPYWHEPLYTWKALLGGSALRHVNIPVVRFGHCSFTEAEVLAGFALLTFMAGA